MKLPFRRSRKMPAGDPFLESLAADPRLQQVTPDALSQLLSGGMGVCDICGGDIDPKTCVSIPADTLAALVEQGYNPFQRGRVSLSNLKAQGLTREEAYYRWRQFVDKDTSPWGLCDLCAKDVADFNTSA